jgi:hypothetical protein
MRALIVEGVADRAAVGEFSGERDLVDPAGELAIAGLLTYAEISPHSA